jgi:hypothetical protein
VSSIRKMLICTVEQSVANENANGMRMKCEWNASIRMECEWDWVVA